jgi:hypothetical protein
LGRETAQLSARHEGFAEQLAQVIEAIRLLTAGPPPAEKRPIGFLAHEEKKH